MADDLERTTADPTLGEALDQYIRTLKPEQRRTQELYVRQYVEHMGESQVMSFLSGSRVESYAESKIKPSDPNAQERVAALKAWFQFLKKKEFTAANYGIHIRVRKMPGRASASQRASTRSDEPPVEMTAEGIQQLRVELGHLQDQRIQTVRAIESAREDGDLRENAPYHAAREQLAFTDQRLKQVEETLKRAVVVDRAHTDDRANVGCTVRVAKLDSGTNQPTGEERYQLVGPREANATERRISVESPVGKQLLGKRPSEVVDVSLPNGTIIRYRIEEVAQPK